MSKNLAFAFISFLIFSILLISCNKKYTYLYQKKYSTDSSLFFQENSEIYKLKANDVLHINIVSNNEEITKQFKVDKQDNNYLNNNSNGANFYLTGFTIDGNGDIEVPILGKINIAGKTISEARKIIVDKTNAVINNAIINVKLVSFKLTFLGEFSTQGLIFFYQEKVNILEGISRVGGVTDYANLKKIKVLRDSSQGKELIIVDLTNPDLLTSDNFYLYPNDIVIADQLRSKAFRMNIQEYMYILSAMSTSITTVLLILQLKSK